MIFMNASPTQTASERFLAGYNCSQAVLYALAPQLGLDQDTALRLACGFGAGIGRTQEVCGAVSGGVMAIGLRHGRGDQEDKARTEDCYRRTQDFLSGFRQRHGSIHCRELIGCDLRTPEGQSQFKERRLLAETCVKCVQTATELAGG